MDIFGIGIGELLVILVIAMVAVGPEKMVKFAGDLGRYLRTFRAVTADVNREFREAFTLEIEDEIDSTEAKQDAAPGAAPTPGASQTPAQPIKIAPAMSSDTQPAQPKPATTPRPSSAAKPEAPPPAEDIQPTPQEATESDEASEAIETAEAKMPQTAAPEPEPVGDLSEILGGAFATEEPEESKSEEAEVEGEEETAQPPEPDEAPQESTEEPVREAPAEDATYSPPEPKDAEPDGGLMAPIPTFGIDADEGSDGQRQADTE